MDWAQFFKPKWYKIIITIVFLLIAFFAMPLFDSCLGGRLCPAGTVNYHPPFSCTAYPDCISKSEATTLNLIQRYPIYLGFIIISYLISCLIFIKSSKNN